MNPATGRTAPGVTTRAALGAALVAAGWSVMWGAVTFWNPLAFAGMWTGAALLMWSAIPASYPGVARHIWLAVLSVPVWWWFELVNSRVQNWHYVYEFDYSSVEYALLSSMAFATVVPAIMAAWSITARVVAGPPTPRSDAVASGPAASEHRGSGAFDTRERHVPIEPPSLDPSLDARASAVSTQESSATDRRLAVSQIAAGIVFQGLVFAFPAQFYPFVWVAPFLVIDGLLAFTRGPSIANDLLHGRWQEAAAIAAAGLVCGFLWEFWNFWSSPKWVYSVPLLGFVKVFEMPVLGYGGYVPFAWSVVQFVRLVDRGRKFVAP